VRATADARNPRVSTERAQNRLQHHLTRQVTSTAGQNVGPVHTYCIRMRAKAPRSSAKFTIGPRPVTLNKLVNLRLIGLVAIAIRTVGIGYPLGERFGRASVGAANRDDHGQGDLQIGVGRPSMSACRT
jgi:hypothetical protein